MIYASGDALFFAVPPLGPADIAHVPRWLEELREAEELLNIALARIHQPIVVRRHPHDAVWLARPGVSG